MHALLLLLRAAEEGWRRASESRMSRVENQQIPIRSLLPVRRSRSTVVATCTCTGRVYVDLSFNYPTFAVISV